MNNFLITLTPFAKTRLVLSLWYSFILLLILIAFSIALVITYNNDVSRIVLLQDFGNHVPRSLSNGEMRLVLAQVRELRSSTRLDIIVIDLVTLLFGGGLSYFLAGKTLFPIQKNMASQKLFIADASHELKSPITTIQTACEVVLRSKNKTKDDYKKVLEQVFGESQRLGRLVSDLLSLSVLDTGTSEHFEMIELSTLIEKKLTGMHPQFTKHKLHLEKSINSHVSIYGDPDKIEQLFIILIDNAIKFTPSGGKIMVKIVNKPQPRLVVQDTGIGIDSKNQEDIFKRFYQVDTSHTGIGTGLGLAIAQSIMQSHHGQIKVESLVGKGSTFICTFPKNTLHPKVNR